MTTCATCARALQPAWKFCIYCGTPTGVAVEEPVADPVAETEGEADDAVEPGPGPDPEDDPEESDDLEGDEFDLVDYDAELDDLHTVDGPEVGPEAELEAPSAGPVRLRPLPAPVDVSGGFDHLELPAAAGDTQDDEDDEEDEDDGYPFDDEPIDLPDDDDDAARSPSIASLASDFEPDEAEQPHAPEDPDTDDDEPRDRTGSINVLAIIALALGVLVSPLAALFGHLALNQLKTSGEKGVIPAWIAIVLGYVWLGAAIVLGITYIATNV